MPRISGIDIPEQKRIEIALRYIYGIGPYKSKTILKKANINPDTRAKDLSQQDVVKIQKILEGEKLEGDLRKDIRENIQRLKRTLAYRGLRHIAGLPSRGQRTRVNARTKRGKRKTIGAMKKEDTTKQQN